MDIKAHTGGIFDTNCYALQAPEGCILFDAPDGTLEWLESSGLKVDLLLLTHGHIDHVTEAAAVREKFQCRTGYHPDSVPLLTERDFFRRFGFQWEIEPVPADFLIEETDRTEYLGMAFQILHVPGHCPGSICFYQPDERVLFGGDVLFAGGIGRWDLPGGDEQVLRQGLKEKVLALDDATTVYPGHGPVTTIGQERRTNPFLQW